MGIRFTMVPMSALQVREALPLTTSFVEAFMSGGGHRIPASSASGRTHLVGTGDHVDAASRHGPSIISLGGCAEAVLGGMEGVEVEPEGGVGRRVYVAGFLRRPADDFRVDVYDTLVSPEHFSVAVEAMTSSRRSGFDRTLAGPLMGEVHTAWCHLANLRDCEIAGIVEGVLTMRARGEPADAIVAEARDLCMRLGGTDQGWGIQMPFDEAVPSFRP